METLYKLEFLKVLAEPKSLRTAFVYYGPTFINLPLRFVFKCRKNRITIDIAFKFQDSCFVIHHLLLKSRDHGSAAYRVDASNYFDNSDNQGTPAQICAVLDDMARHITEFVMLAHSPTNLLAHLAQPATEATKPIKPITCHPIRIEKGLEHIAMCRNFHP